jgi:hypothetical protein
VVEVCGSAKQAKIPLVRNARSMETPVVDWLLASSPDIRSGCFCDFSRWII